MTQSVDSDSTVASQNSQSSRKRRLFLDLGATLLQEINTAFSTNKEIQEQLPGLKADTFLGTQTLGRVLPQLSGGSSSNQVNFAPNDACVAVTAPADDDAIASGGA